MFQQPSSGIAFVAPAEPIDPTQRYLVQLMDLHDEGVSRFADATEENPPHRIRWTFRIHDFQTKVALLNVEGQPYELFAWTSSKTGKAKGKTAKAREFMEALLGRPLEDSEITPDIHTQLIGKAAVALFEEKEKETQTGETYTRVEILKLSPAKGVNQAQPAAASRAAAVLSI